MIRMVRSIISSITEGKIKRFFGAGSVDETFTDRECWQHYGYTSRPLSGAEGIVLVQGNVVHLIASDDRRYRISLQDGEVALYTDEGDYIHFKRGKEILVSSGNKVTVEATTTVEVTAPDVIVTASAKCQVNSPDVIVTASVKCQIDSPEINLSGNRAGLNSLIDERFKTLFDSHVHSGCGGTSNSGAPTQTIDLNNHATQKVKGL